MTTAEMLDLLRANPLPQQWVDELREILDLLVEFPDNDQRARFLLGCNFLRDHGDAIADRVRTLDAAMGDIA